MFTGTLIRNCVPYGLTACENAAENLNLTYIGYVDGNGCYAYKPDHKSYANNVYYGYTGSDDEKKKPLDSSSIYRPDGFDCKSINDQTDLTINCKIHCCNGGNKYIFMNIIIRITSIILSINIFQYF